MTWLAAVGATDLPPTIAAVASRPSPTCLATLAPAPTAAAAVSALLIIVVVAKLSWPIAASWITLVRRRRWLTIAAAATSAANFAASSADSASVELAAGPAPGLDFSIAAHPPMQIPMATVPPLRLLDLSVHCHSRFWSTRTLVRELL